jgi:hypothetical protein
MEPAKSCRDASRNETIVYRLTKPKGQMAVCSVPGDTLPRFSAMFPFFNGRIMDGSDDAIWNGTFFLRVVPCVIAAVFC